MVFNRRSEVMIVNSFKNAEKFIDIYFQPNKSNKK